MRVDTGGLCPKCVHKSGVGPSLYAPAMDSQTVDTVTAIFALLAFAVSLFALYFAQRSTTASEKAATEAGKSADAAKRSADAAESQAVISATEFAASAPLLEATYYGNRWTVQNNGQSTAYNLEIDCEPDGCTVKPEKRTLPVGDVVTVFPKALGKPPISVSWTRTPDGGPDDEPARRIFHLR